MGWRFAFVAGLVSCTSIFGFAQQRQQYQVTNIGFYNLENLFNTVHDEGVDDYEFLPTGKRKYTDEVYKDRLLKLSSVIKDIGTDMSPEGLAVLGVSEIENEGVLKDLCSQEAIVSRSYKIVHYDSPDARGVDVALLYNPKYFSPDTSAALRVDLPADSEGRRHKTRDVLWVRGDLVGERFHFFVNHWPSRLGGEAASAPNRAAAAAVCRKAIDSILKAEPNAKIVVMGDLNDNPNNASVTKVLNASGNKDKLKDGQLYNPWVDLFQKGIGTLAYQDSWSLFDQIIISSALLQKQAKGLWFYKQGIFKRSDMIQSSGRYRGYPKRSFDFDNYAGGFSDHFPTCITLLKAVNN